MGYDITIVSDEKSWINPFLPSLVERLNKEHTVRWIHQVNHIQGGDFVFYLSCGQIASSAILKKSTHNLVVHASDLPKGKGWSPLTWKILEGKNIIPIVLLEADEKVDSGMIYLKDKIEFSGYELIDELRFELAKKTIDLCVTFLEQYPHIIKKGIIQSGESSYYPRRRPKDSELNVNQSIREQFNLLRVVDNDRYPAFFKIDGHTYQIKVEKTDDLE